MKIIGKCPKCGHEQIIVVNYLVMAILWITIIGGIIYSILLNKKYRCKKCGAKVTTHKELTSSTTTKTK